MMKELISKKKQTTMRNPFSGSSPIYALIDEYAEWKFGIHPYQAGAYRSLLLRFVKARKIDYIEDITNEHIAYFLGGELSEFYARKAKKAFRSFLWYATMAGYECIPFQAVTSLDLQEGMEPAKVIERKPHWKLAGAVKWKRQN